MPWAVCGDAQPSCHLGGKTETSDSKLGQQEPKSILLELLQLFGRHH